MATTAVAKQRSDVKNMVKKYESQFALALPSMINSERFVRIALTQFTKTPKLYKCTQESLVSSLLQSAQMGLEPDGRVAHLIPYGETCQLIVDYKGLAELALRSGQISYLHADVVCENDEFEEDKGQVLLHRVNRRKPRGKAYAVYTYAKMKDGSESYHIMGLDEVLEIRDKFSVGYKTAKKYNKKDNPWITRPNEMYKKTCFRQHAKWLPLSPEFRDAVASDPEVQPEPVDITSEVDHIPEDSTLPDEPTAPKVEEGEVVGENTDDVHEEITGKDSPVDASDDGDVKVKADKEGTASETLPEQPKKKTRMSKPKSDSVTAPAKKRTLADPN